MSLVTRGRRMCQFFAPKTGVCSVLTLARHKINNNNKNEKKIRPAARAGYPTRKFITFVSLGTEKLSI